MSTIHDEINSRISLSSVVGRYVKLKKHNQEFTGCCPFHQEKTPSFSVNDKKQVYFCFGCGAKGNLFTFLEKIKNQTHEQVLADLCRETGVSMPSSSASRELDQTVAVLEKTCQFFQAQLAKSKFALSYLTSRGISQQAIEQFHLGYAPTGEESLKFFAQAGFDHQTLQRASLIYENEQKTSAFFTDRIMFPIRLRGNKVVGFGGRAVGESKAKYLNSRDSELFKKGKLLFSSGETEWEKPELVVVEGYADVVMLWQYQQRAVAPLGTALTSDQLQLLWRSCSEPIICFDGDPSGQKAMARALELALPLLSPERQLKFLMLPSGEDPDTFLRNRGQEQWQKLVKQAQPVHHYLLELGFQLYASLPDPVRRWTLTEQYFAEKLNLISNQIVRKHLRGFINDQLWQASKKRPKGLSSLKKVFPVKLNQERKETKENKILGIILYNPTLLNYIEKIATNNQWLSSLVATFETNYPGWKRVLFASEGKIRLEKEELLTTINQSAEKEVAEEIKLKLRKLVEASYYSSELAQKFNSQEEVQNYFSQLLEELEQSEPIHKRWNNRKEKHKV